MNKGVENLPALRQAMSGIDNQNVQQDILETFVDRGQLRELELDHPRQLALMQALVRFF